MVKFWVLFFYCLFSLMSALTSFRNGFSTGNTTLSFEDNFAPQVKVFGRRGTLYVEPLNVHLPLTNYIDLKQNDTTELVISTSSRGKSTWTIIFLNFISIIACALFALLVIDDYLNSWREQTHRAGMVNAMPSLNFTAVDDSTSTSSTCAMCLEDYKVAEKLRVLPCHHMFHADCVDPRLISFRATCPVCGDDALPEEVAIERIRTIITADLLNVNRLVNHYFLFHAEIFLCAAWDPLSKLLYSISWLPLILSLAASFRVAYAFPLIALNLQSMYDKMDTIQAINDRAARRIRILRFCLVICFISLVIGFAVVLPIALVTKTSPCAYFAICLAMVLGNYIMRL